METVWVVGGEEFCLQDLIATIKTTFNFSWPTNILIFF